MTQTPAHVLHVDNMPSFLAAEFNQSVNAVCLTRKLKGDFNALAEKLLRPHLWNFLRKQRFMHISAFAKETECLDGPMAKAAQQVFSDIRALKESVYTAKSEIAIVVTRRPVAKPFHIDGTFPGLPHKTTVICTYAGATTQYTGNDNVEMIYRDNRARVGNDAVVHEIPLQALWKHARDYNRGIHPLAHRSPPAGETRLMLLGTMP